MKKRVNRLPWRWICRIAIITLASYTTGLSFGWCLLAYLGIMFLFEFTKNMIIVILGIVLVIAVTAAMFFGLMSL